MTGLSTAIAILGLSLVAAGAGSAESNGVTTYPVPDMGQACPYRVIVNGQPIPIEKAGEYQGCWYARFEAELPVVAEVRVMSSAATMMVLKPEKFRTNLTGTKSKIQPGLKFDINTPGPRVITVTSGSKEIWPMIILAEKPKARTAPAGAKVYRVKEHLKPSGVQTQVIQKILDDCAAGGGGVVQFDTGTYLTGPLFIGDNTTVMMAPGSVIQGSRELKDYESSRKPTDVLSNAPGAGVPALVNFDSCKNSKIIGLGVIDAAGSVIRNEYGLHVRALAVTRGENINVEDVILRNSASWTMQVLGSKDVKVDNVKVLADWLVGNTDGINPDCSQNVTISNYFGYCGDDAVAIKNTSKSADLQGCRNIRVHDCIVMTRKTSFKIGTETHKDVSDVLFENCESVNSSRGIGIYMEDGATISNITYRDMKFDLMEYPGEGSSGMPYTASVGHRNGIGKIRNVTFERVVTSAPYVAAFNGCDISSIDGVTFKDCSLEIRNRSIKMDKVPVFELNWCKGFSFENCNIAWNTVLTEVWDGAVKQANSENLKLDGLEEIRK